MTAKLIEVIESIEHAGRGVEENPTRTVTRYYSKVGVLLAEYDPWVESTRPSSPFSDRACSDREPKGRGDE